MGDTVLPHEDPDALQLDLLGSEALEQAAPLAKQNRDDMELEFVEDAGGRCELGGSGAVDEHVLVGRRLLGLVIAVVMSLTLGDERPLRYVDAGLVAGDDEDRHAVVVVAAPAARRLERPSTGDDRAGGHELIDDLTIDGARTADGLEIDVAVRHRPLVQAVPAVAEGVVRSLIVPGR
jgi:hypothetical protein